MFRTLEGGEVQGVLNDFDLCKVRSKEEESRSHTRTGTKPFMALDALKADVEEHQERFDWESFMWALIWITSRYKPGKNEYSSKPLSDWLVSDPQQIWKNKWAFLTNALDAFSCKGYYRNVYLKWCLPLCDAFERSYRARRNELNRMRALRLGQAQAITKEDMELDESKLPNQVSYQGLWAMLEDDCEP